MKYYVRIACSVLFVVITAGVARADDTATPATAATPNATPGCTIFLGGNGARSKNADFNQKWINVNKAASNAAIDKLTALHYRIEPLFSDAADPQQSGVILMKAIQEKRCDQVVQLSHLLSMASDPKAPPHLTLQVLVFHLEAIDDKGHVKIVPDYQHDYPFVLTQDVMEHLSMSAVGATVATDVDAAHVLKARGP